MQGKYKAFILYSLRPQNKLHLQKYTRYKRKHCKMQNPTLVCNWCGQSDFRGSDTPSASTHNTPECEKSIVLHRVQYTDMHRPVDCGDEPERPSTQQTCYRKNNTVAAKNINSGSVTIQVFQLGMTVWQRASMYNRRSLKLMQLNGIQPSRILLFKLVLLFFLTVAC